MNSILIAKNVIKRLIKEPVGAIFLFAFPIIAGLFAVIVMGGSGEPVDLGFSS